MTRFLANIWPNLVIAACVLALVAVIEHMGELRGRYSAQVECNAAKTRAVETEHQAYVKEVKRGSDAAAELRAQLDAAQLANDDLTRRLAHVSRFVSTPACPSPGDGQLTVLASCAGTQPLAIQACPPVPAEFLVAPQPLVPLEPTSSSASQPASTSSRPKPTPKSTSGGARRSARDA